MCFKDLNVISCRVATARPAGSVLISCFFFSFYRTTGISQTVILNVQQAYYLGRFNFELNKNKEFILDKPTSEMCLNFINNNLSGKIN